MNSDESREVVFEGKIRPIHRAADRVGSTLRGLPGRPGFRGVAVFGALASVITLLAVARGPSARAPLIEASSTPSPTPSIAPQTLTGPGPFVIWSLSGPSVNGVDLYAVDFSNAGQSTNPPNIFLGNFLDLSAPLPQAPSSNIMIPLAPNLPTGSAIAILRRSGVSILEQAPLQFGQGAQVLSTRDGKQVAALLHVTGDAYAMLIRSATGPQRRQIPFSVPSDLPGAVPAVFDWDAGRSRFLLAFTGGTRETTYELDYSGRLTRLKWLEGYTLFGTGSATADGSRFVFDDPSHHALRIADFRDRSLRTIARPDGVHDEPVLSPDGRLVAYGHDGNHFAIARVSDGRVLKSLTVDAVSISPLAWLDSHRLIALEQSPDLRTGDATQALLLVTIDGGPNGEPFSDYLASGGNGFNYVGWLR